MATSYKELELNILKQTNKVINQKSLAKEVGFSVGKVNFVLKALIEKGFIKVEKFINADNKLQYKYLLTENGLKEKIILTEKFIKIKKEEYEKLQKELEEFKKIRGNKEL